MLKNQIKKQSLRYVLVILSSIIIGILIIILSYSLINRIFISPPIESSIEIKTNEGIETQAIQLNILNACNEDGIANVAKNYLRARGFDVVEIGNYSQTVSKSFIIDRVGDIISAQKVAYAIGIDDSLIITKIDSGLFLRNTVVLGKNYIILKPYN